MGFVKNIVDKTLAKFAFAEVSFMESRWEKACPKNANHNIITTFLNFKRTGSSFQEGLGGMVTTAAEETSEGGGEGKQRRCRAAEIIKNIPCPDRGRLRTSTCSIPECLFR